MKEDVEKLKQQVTDLQKELALLTEKVNQLAETSYKTSTREIMNREVQFLQKCYDKNNNLIPEINAT